MPTVIIQPLVAGQRLNRDEFMRRWEAMPDLKHAELIGGLVYMASPTRIEHRSHDSLAGSWVGYYGARTRGCDPGSHGTWLMLEDAPQPDIDLRILPEYGGQSRVEGDYPAGAPELVVEVSYSSASLDLGPKMELYRSAGVKEYIVVLVRKSKIVWNRLVDEKYVPLQPDSDGILRSIIFPGLWLDPEALLAGNGARIFDVAELGLRSAEHQRFVLALGATLSK